MSSSTIPTSTSKRMMPSWKSVLETKTKMEGPPRRPMKYPYTYAAKIAQFPFKFHVDNSPIFKWWLVSCVLCLPVFYKIQKLSYAPGNVEKWRQIRQEMFNPSEHH